MSTEIQLEVDVLWDELKDWEASVDAEWTEEYRVAYMTKKRDIVKDFFMNQVARWEKEQNAPAPAGGVDDDEEAIKRQLEEEDRLARQLLEEEYAAKVASDKAAADKAAADKAAADKAAADKAAADKAAADKVAAEKAAAEKAAAQKAAAEKAAAEKVAAEKAAEAKARAEAEAKAKTAAAAAASSPRLGAESPTLARTNSSSASPALQRVEVDTSVALSDLEQDAALEKEFKEANLRITKNPGRQAADLTDTAVLATYIRLRNDRDTLNWMMLGYADDKSPNKITVVGVGDGGWNEMVANVPEDPIYLYLKHSFGDTGRAKFVFLTYVPDSLAGMKKSRVIGHRPAVEKLLKYMQITWHVLEKSELQIETLTSKLLAAGGANYSVQEQDKGDFSSYKKTTANFYAATEKRGNLGQVVYQTGPLTTTPMDISGRTMVASQADFRNNIVDLK